MRPSSVRKTIALISTVAVVAVTLVGAAASAATIFSGAVQVNLGPSFPDPETWALMVASFGLIGAGVRSRRRSVVLA